MIKRILYSYFFFCVIQVLCFTITYTFLLIANNMQFAGNSIEALFLFSIQTFIIGCFNTVFLIFLHLTGINNVILLNAKSCIIESILYYVLSVVIGFIIVSIPTESKFYYHDIIINGNIISKNAYTLKFYYTDEAQIAYIYIILLLFYIVKKLNVANRYC